MQKAIVLLPLEDRNAGDVFLIYGESSPQAGVDYSNPVDVVEAFKGTRKYRGHLREPHLRHRHLGKQPIGGHLRGQHLRKRHLQSAGHIRWQSKELPFGQWTFGVKTRDAAGNVSSNAIETTVTLNTAPRGCKMTGVKSYDSATDRVTFILSPSVDLIIGS